MGDGVRYIIYGAGKMGRMVFDFLGKENVIGFADGNADKIGKKFLGKPILDTAGIKLQMEKYKDLVVVIAVKSAEACVQIIKNISATGVQYTYCTEVLSEFIREDRIRYEKLNRRKTFAYDASLKYEVSVDRYAEAGTAGSYFWQDLWAAKRIRNEGFGAVHDIGSRLDGFIGHLLAAGIDVTMIDIRPLSFSLPGLTFIQANATDMKGIEDGSIRCLSALCSLEHFGLGRYGDPIDPEACFKCFHAIQKKISKGGRAYISVPIGAEHLEFNAHRIFYASTIVKEFSGMRLVEFSSCRGAEFEENISDIHRYDAEFSRGGRFGLFAFEKD